MAKNTKAPPLKDFRAWRKRLRKAYQRAWQKERTAQGLVRPRDQPNNVMRLQAYAYFCELKARGLISQLRAHIEDRDGTRWNGHGDSDEQWVMRLLVARGKQHADQDEKKIANANALRSRMCAEFKLAAHNKVRPEALLGFLYEVGPAAQIKADAMDPPTYNWAEPYRSATATKRTAKRRKQHSPVTKQVSTDAWDEEEDLDADTWDGDYDGGWPDG
ncbi:hypothetical protein VCJ71_02910 [Alteriqipengyuania sp. WL0013]|uniref:hypothetical protein n=1 Tax=Alteriqipengyuania sp. WL0013 TaxID=3110773 RepID=UPI002C9E4CF1|nr:hypothetical protein [Alteriqipengyuania sp. WL0013]MEB3415011.1 hypothetical protein [Alteriqipengyuania sp. WL0013]